MVVPGFSHCLVRSLLVGDDNDDDDDDADASYRFCVRQQCDSVARDSRRAFCLSIACTPTARAHLICNPLTPTIVGARDSTALLFARLIRAALSAMPNWLPDATIARSWSFVCCLLGVNKRVKAGKKGEEAAEVRRNRYFVILAVCWQNSKDVNNRIGVKLAYL